MKTILVPTDFSECADNAITYAIEIARLTKAKLILFNVYQSQAIPAEVPILLPIEETAAEANEVLKRLVKRLQKKSKGQVQIEYKSAWGFPVEQINLFSEEHSIDLIVMGMQGAGFLAEKVIGSVTTALIRKAQHPVLAIDQHVKFKSLKKIVLACDYAETKNNEVLKPLKEFAQLFKSHIYVLNVISESEATPTITKAVAGIRLDRELESLDHSFHFTENKNVIEGINDFVEENTIDMVVMIPRMHTSLKDIFSEPNTKRMAFHTKTPLLAIHE
jgi:nucleotide-binding universal stress UspA family protein